MSFWDSVKSWFKSEASSAKELAGDLQADWSADLDRKEAEMAATPEERIAQLQDKISGNESTFDEIKTKIESTGTELDSPIDNTDPNEL